MLDILEDKLRKHDWFFSYADDSTSYNKGLQESREINALMKEAGNAGFGNAAARMHNLYNPGANPKCFTYAMHMSELTFADGKYTTKFITEDAYESSYKNEAE